MAESLLYLTAADIRALRISPDQARRSVDDAFRDHAAGLNTCLPKAAIDLGPGHGFQSMAAASKSEGIATIKWVSMAPVGPDSKAAGINATICVNAYQSGLPLAIMDGNEITLIRTAALSAAAASHMVAGVPKTIGMIGCGLQAYAHLAAFTCLFPSLERLLACSRTRHSAEQLADHARRAGLQADVCDHADQVLEESDIVISMVPGAPGLVPFLDAGRLQQHAFVSAVDIGRSWLPESFVAFDIRATDSLTQSKAPYDVNSRPVETAPFQTDLVALCGGDTLSDGGRRLFCFRGYGLGDLALAGLAYRQAGEQGMGTRLPR